MAVDPETFFTSPAISFEHQPRLKELFDAVVRTNQAITLVLGAGLSLDSGLPSWQALIDAMADCISEEKWQRLARLDRSDPMRKAEYLVRMVMEDSPDTEEVAIQRALYASGRGTSPGQLADSVARLAFLLDGRVRIITTNFDNVVELALQEYLPNEQIKSYGLDDADGSWGQERPGRASAVLHVHGMTALHTCGGAVISGSGGTARRR